MAETQITRCPHCQTTFRIRLEQLAKAKGAVRCGSCLQVFKAVDNLVPSNSSPANPAIPSASVPKAAVKKTPVKLAAKAVPKMAPKPNVAPTPAPKPKKEEISFDDIPDQINDDPLEDFGIRQPERQAGETFDSNLQLDDSIFSMQESAKPSRYSLMNQDQNQEINYDLDDSFGSDSFGSHDSDESWASNLIDDESSSPSKNANDDESWADALLDVDDDLIDEIDMGFTTPNIAKEKDDFVPSLEDDSDADQFHLGGGENFDQ